MGEYIKIDAATVVHGPYFFDIYMYKVYWSVFPSFYFFAACSQADLVIGWVGGRTAKTIR
jgi:hypothetical protein